MQEPPSKMREYNFHSDKERRFLDISKLGLLNETLMLGISVLVMNGKAFCAPLALENGICPESRLAAGEMQKARLAFFSVSLTNYMA